MGVNDLSILTGASAPGAESRGGLMARATATAKSGNDERAAVEKAAKDFESVLVEKLIEEMKNTVPDSGLVEDGASKQMQDLFWLYLGQHVGQQGGLGLWKQMARQFHAPASTQANASMEMLR